jgi:hypothetical protein
MSASFHNFEHAGWADEPFRTATGYEVPMPAVLAAATKP